MGFIKFHVDGKPSRVESMTLKEMQEFVGGYIEVYKNIICNEDGRMLKLPQNRAYPQFLGNVIEVEPGTVW